MREEIVNDKVKYSVNRNAQTNRKGKGITQRFFGENHQKHRKKARRLVDKMSFNSNAPFFGS